MIKLTKLAAKPLNESKNDYVARSNKTDIFIKNGYKYFKEEQLDQIFDIASRLTDSDALHNWNENQAPRRIIIEY